MPQHLSEFPWLIRPVGDLTRIPKDLLSRFPIRGTLHPEVGTCIHTDLMDAGLIPDPAVGDIEKAVEWVSWIDWQYSTSFIPDTDRIGLIGAGEVFLCFDTLDTAAGITLNGTRIGTANSEFIPWRFRTQGMLRSDTNHLVITLRSPLRVAYELAKQHARPHNGHDSPPPNPPWHPYNMMRKCASNFGWDWGPRVATVGLAGVRLESGIQSSEFRTQSSESARAFPRVSFNPATFTFSLDGPHPRPMFIKGANWIPEGLWPRDRTRDRLRNRLLQAKAAGMNMLRVWGGGRYESEDFYELCTELGILVWQDFMFACACYPEEEPFRSLVEKEARHHVARLSRHPCVVLWCGGNENHWAYESWGFKERLSEAPSPTEGVGGGLSKTWGRWYFHDLLPRIVAELSPHTPYIPDSPFSPSGAHPNDPHSGDRHTWDLFGEDFRQLVPLFCSEFGVQSPSNLDTLREAGLLDLGTPSVSERVSSSSRVPPSLLSRQRGPGGMKRWYDDFFAKANIPAPTTFEEWHAAAQKLQADWLYLALVWLRANFQNPAGPSCSGALIWQLNDAWPGLSWSLIDSAGREKPAYHAVAKAFADRLAEIVPFNNIPHLVAINDTDEPWMSHYKLDDRLIPFAVAARSVTKIPLAANA